MKRLVVWLGTDYINIPCDRIFQDEHFLYGYRGEDLVGMFMIGTFEQAYLNEMKDGKESHTDLNKLRNNLISVYCKA